MAPNDDGNLEQPTGGQEQPTSAPSGGQGQQLSDVGTLVKQIEELGKQVRGLQKGTDKRFERQESNIKRILELREAGMNETQIERELWIDQQIKGHEAPPPSPVGNGNEGGQAPNVESAFKTVEEYGLSANDPDFINLIRKSGNMKPNDFDAQVKEYVLGKVKPPKTANPADVVQPPVRAGATSVNTDALSVEMAQLYKNPSKPGAMARIAEIQKALKEAGV
jgi:hypothetical protein